MLIRIRDRYWKSAVIFKKLSCSSNQIKFTHKSSELKITNKSIIIRYSFVKICVKMNFLEGNFNAKI